MKLLDDQKKALRLWCMTHNSHRMYEIYQWLIDSNSTEDIQSDQFYP